jgi:hypothetical protein
LGLGTDFIQIFEIFELLSFSTTFRNKALNCLTISLTMSEMNRITKSDSFDSMGSVDFLVDELTINSASKPEPSEMRKKEMSGEIVESFLQEDKSRFVLFPIKHHDVSPS